MTATQLFAMQFFANGVCIALVLISLTFSSVGLWFTLRDLEAKPHDSFIKHLAGALTFYVIISAICLFFVLTHFLVFPGH